MRCPASRHSSFSTSKTKLRENFNYKAPTGALCNMRLTTILGGIMRTLLLAFCLNLPHVRDLRLIRAVIRQALMTDGPLVVACGGNNRSAAVTVHFPGNENSNKKTTVAEKITGEVRTNTDKKAKKTFKKSPGKPYQELLVFLETVSK